MLVAFLDSTSCLLQQKKEKIWFLQPMMKRNRLQKPNKL